MVLVDLLQASLSFKSGNSPEMQKLKNKEKKKKERGREREAQKREGRYLKCSNFPGMKRGKGII